MKPAIETKVFDTIAELRSWRAGIGTKEDGKLPSLGFVPTMGALHPGHMSLVQKAQAECAHVLVSIFVNPLQFVQGEDFDRYPRPFEKDLQFCREAGVHAVFHPRPEEMYPNGQERLTRVIPPDELIHHLCGAFRPGHFEGVATVVSKLFGQVQPDRAYFGEKDYQQLVVIRRMVKDLDIPVTIVPAPTLREHDGLAMSSRNVYLSAEQRELAPVVHETLKFVIEKSRSGDMSLGEAIAAGRARLVAVPGATVQYLEACDPESLEPVDRADRPMVVLVAVKFGSVRLIDNVIAP